MQETPLPTQQLVYLTFHIAGEEYAVPVDRVSRVVEIGPITKVPSMPACIRGLMNLRGSVVGVVDLGLKFGFPAAALTKWTCLVVVEVEIEGDRIVMGLIADGVGRVIEVLPEEIGDPPAFGTQIRVDYLTGMVNVGEKFILILDIDLVLSPDEMLTVGSLKGADSLARSAGSLRTSDQTGGSSRPSLEGGVP